VCVCGGLWAWLCLYVLFETLFQTLSLLSSRQRVARVDRSILFH